MRINKYIAHCGYTSRRKADELIEKGKVKVNGKVIYDFSYDVKEDDELTINGEILSLVEKKYYLAFNKPVGVISSNYDKYNPVNVFDFINIDTKLFTLGRLDKDSCGLILITNDGDLYNNLMHPSKEVKKYYQVRLNKKINKKDLEKLRNGVDIGGYITHKASIELLEDTYRPLVDVVISEGKNRQIRRMFLSLGYEVINLKRYRIANIRLGELKEGNYRHLTDIEVRQLKNYG